MTGPRCICGIDPGISGAIAFFFPDHPERVTCEDVPIAAGNIDAVTLAARMTIMVPDVVIIEQVGAMPAQGVSSMFKFGRAFGTVIGVVEAIKLPLHLVAPTRWKAHFRLSKAKEEARALALRTFPACGGQFSRKKDHGRAEAALIARYGAETLHLIGGSQ
jgi:crossover junction endodeoxyribonuclease RuvC